MKNLGAVYSYLLLIKGVCSEYEGGMSISLMCLPILLGGICISIKSDGLGS